MSANQNIPELDAQGLRKFGLQMAVMIACLFGLFFPWLLDKAFPAWPWAGAALLSLWSLVHPISLKYLYHGWMRLGLVLGWFSSRIVLGTLFYLVFTPVSAVLRMRGVDPLRRRLDPAATTYRKQCKPRDISHMERPC